MNKIGFLGIAFFVSMYAPADLTLEASCVKYFNQLYESQPTGFAESLAFSMTRGLPKVELYCDDESLRKVWEERYKALYKFNGFLQDQVKKECLGYFRADFNKTISDFVEKEPISARILLQDSEGGFAGAAVQLAVRSLQK